MNQPVKTSLGAAIILIVAITAMTFVWLVNDSRVKNLEDELDAIQVTPLPKNSGPIACTEEAKICPDGSAVGRTGPNCEFDLCPETAKIQSLDATWDLYTNSTLGFSMKVPKLVYNDDSKKKVPLEILENGDFVFITYNAGYNNYQEGKKIIENSSTKVDKGSGISFLIVVKSVENEGELLKFVQERYGSGCKIGSKKESGQPGTYDIEIDAEAGMDLCPINYRVAVKYSAQKGAVAAWDMGQDNAFSFSGKVDDSPDTEMAKSFKFIQKSAAEKQLSFIKSAYIKNGKQYLDLDYAEWFEGEEAKKAALQDGECVEIEFCAPNDFYIRNNNPKIRTLEVRSDALIVRASAFESSDTGIKNIDFSELSGYYQSSQKEMFMSLPFWISIENGVVVRIDEQYIP